jgi:hypothetical protein
VEDVATSGDKGNGDGTPTVYRITGARKGITEDVGARQRRYLISMGVRTVCFVLAIVASGWLRWVLVLAAVVLPYVSVVFANGGREPSPGPPTTTLLDQRPMLEAPAAPPDDPPESGSPGHGSSAA